MTIQSCMYSVDPASAKAHQIAVWSLYDPDKTAMLHAIDAVDVDSATPIRPPQVLVVEDQFAGRNSKSSLGLARTAGHLIARLGCTVTKTTLAPLPGWKRALTGAKAPKTSKHNEYEIHLAMSTHLGRESWHMYSRHIDANQSSQQRMMDITDAVGIGVWWLRANGYDIL